MSENPEDARELRPIDVGDDVIAAFGDGEALLPDPPEGTVGFTHFDAPGSEDDQVTVLLTRQHLEALTPGAMVRIDSPADGDAPARQFQGAVIAGPYAEPDGLAAASPIAVATTLGGKARVLLPAYHGRCLVQVTAELVDGRANPPRHRPRPNSPVVPLSDAETADALGFAGDVRLGSLLGNPDVPLHLDTKNKHQLPRHLGVLGTTGGGKSNTVAGLVKGVSDRGASVVLLDVEGEYVHLDRPTARPEMIELLKAAGGKPAGVADFQVLYPVGRETAREGGDATPFTLAWENLSPYAAMDVLDLTEAQQARFVKAYDLLKVLMKKLNLFPRHGNAGDVDRLLELDEFDGGYPRMTLGMLRDVVNVCFEQADREGATRRRGGGEDGGGGDAGRRPLYSPQLRDHADDVRRAVAQARLPGNVTSWMALVGKLNRVARLGVFDNPKAKAIDPAALTAPGHVTVIDLSDTDSPLVNNLVIAGLLRQVQRQQDADFAAGQWSPTLVVIEEAHEFLSAARLRQQQNLFDQVARIAKRGRKRWLGLCFVTQLPQHLPDEVLGLINGYVLHAVRDPQVVARLGRQIPGLDKAQWGRLTALAPGQAVVSLATARRPVVAQIDPAPGELRLVD